MLFYGLCLVFILAAALSYENRTTQMAILGIALALAIAIAVLRIKFMRCPKCGHGLPKGRKIRCDFCGWELPDNER